MRPEQQAGSSAMVNQDGGGAANDGGQENVPTYTEEEMRRMVMVECGPDGEEETGGENIEVAWHLMMQSGVFANLWRDAFSDEKADGPAIPLKGVGAECFRKIIAWMGQQHGRPVPVVREDAVTGERVRFNLTDWERTFFAAVDFETLKELYMASNYLDIRSLYLYCAQECARRIEDKDEHEIREMLCLPDDIPEEQKAVIRKEFDIPAAAAGGGGGAQQPANNAGNNNGGGGGPAVQPQ